MYGGAVLNGLFNSFLVENSGIPGTLYAQMGTWGNLFVLLCFASRFLALHSFVTNTMRWNVYCAHCEWNVMGRNVDWNPVMECKSMCH